MARIDAGPGACVQARPAASTTDYALLPLKMTFDDGGAYALLGPSGCGKTTLLNIISGLLQPSQGSVQFGPPTSRGRHRSSATSRRCSSSRSSTTP
jgi:glycerol transport system ATP-binding protein